MGCGLFAFRFRWFPDYTHLSPRGPSLSGWNEKSLFEGATGNRVRGNWRSADADKHLVPAGCGKVVAIAQGEPFVARRGRIQLSPGRRATRRDVFGEHHAAL